MRDKNCSGCSWIDDGGENWCQMFEEKPSELPCGQHDKFKLEREITGRMIRKNPIILIGMVQEAMAKNKTAKKEK